MRLLHHPDRRIHHAKRWYYRMGRRVWFREIWRFLTQDHEEEASALPARRAG